MGLALHCHGELKLTNGIMEEKWDTKWKKKLFPQALAHFQALQNEFLAPPMSKDDSPSSNPEEIG